MKKLTLLSFIVLLFGCESDTPEPIVNNIVDSENALPFVYDDRGCYRTMDVYQSLEYLYSGGSGLTDPDYDFQVGYRRLNFSSMPQVVPPYTHLDLEKNGLLIGRVHSVDNECHQYKTEEYFSMEYVPFLGEDGFRLMGNGVIPTYRSHRNKIKFRYGNPINDLVSLSVREKGVGGFIPIENFVFNAGKRYEFLVRAINYNDGDYFNYQVYIKFPGMTENNSMLFHYKSDGADLDKSYQTEKVFPYPLFLPQYEVEVEVILKAKVFQSHVKTVQVPG